MTKLLEIDFDEKRAKIDKTASNNILRELDFFFNGSEDKLQSKRSKNISSNAIDTTFQNRWVLISCALIIILNLSVIILFLLGSSVLVINSILVLFLGSLLGFTIYSCWRAWKPVFLLVKRNRSEAILSAGTYSIDFYYKIIDELGEKFYAEHLQREELRFRLIIEDRKQRSNIVKKGTLLLSIAIIALWIFVYGSPKEGTEINLLSGTIVNLSGISLVIKVALDILFEWFSQQDIDIYNKCILILQNAQIIAREEESDALRAYDEAILANDEAIPFEEAIAKIEQNR